MKNNESVYERIIGLSDLELSKMVFEEHSNYREDALEIAKKELARREINQENYRDIDIPLEDCPPKELGISWMRFYVYISIPYGIISRFYEAYDNSFWPNYLIVGISFIVSVFTIYGMHKWKIWGWNLNIILLILSAFVFPVLRAKNIDSYLSFAVTKLLIWCIPNFIYFWRRIKLFER